MIAYPADVAFYWSFGGMNRTWEAINESSGEHEINSIRLTSYLTITSFKPDQKGFYQVYGANSVRKGRKYQFHVLPYSELFS